MKRLGHGQRVVEEDLEEVGADDSSKLLVARDFRAAVRTAAVSALAAMAQQCSAVDQQAEQWMVEGAVRVPVSRAELYVPQGGSERE